MSDFSAFDATDILPELIAGGALPDAVAANPVFVVMSPKATADLGVLAQTIVDGRGGGPTKQTATKALAALAAPGTITDGQFVIWPFGLLLDSWSIAGVSQASNPGGESHLLIMSVAATGLLRNVAKGAAATQNYPQAVKGTAAAIVTAIDKRTTGDWSS